MGLAWCSPLLRQAARRWLIWGPSCGTAQPTCSFLAQSKQLVRQALDRRTRRKIKV
ncbi:unnamed protein product [Amoebophrya sp. A25]|nr:unnamed protein product [Amoebophrya sp. A25]|eukprot:GSA25T00025625001.1